MKRNSLFVATIGALLVLMISAITLNSHEITQVTKGADETYTIVFDKNTNKIGREKPSIGKFYSGVGIVSTKLNNEISFEYNGFSNIAKYWQIIQNGGSFENNDPINGMKSLKFTFADATSELKVEWSYNKTFNAVNSDVLNQDNPSTDFNNYSPNYIKVTAIGDQNVSKIQDGLLIFGCSNLYHKVSLTNPEPSKGVITGEGVYKFGEEVTLKATPNFGYSFDGWYDKTNTKLSDNLEYKFLMKDEDITYTAKFVRNEFSLALNNTTPDCGMLTGGGFYNAKQNATLSAIATDGYSFDGWYENNILLSNDNPYTYVMPSNNVEIEGRFKIGSYKVNLASNDETKGSVSGSGTYDYLQEVTIKANPVVGYAFIGWYDNGVLVSNSSIYKFNMPGHDINYIAKFDTACIVSVISDDSTICKVSGDGTYVLGETVTVKAEIINDDYEFVQWIDDEYTVRSKDLEYTFVVNSDTTLYALYKNSSMLFGSYPQTMETDQYLIVKLTEELGDTPNINEAGWTNYYDYYIKSIDDYQSLRWYKDIYLEANKEKYRAVYYERKPLYYPNGHTDGSVAFFKFEPIQWKTLDSSGLILSKYILDKDQVYYNDTEDRIIDKKRIYANNYEFSFMRTWLNNTFLNNAFNLNEQEKIDITKVDNSGDSYGVPGNQYASNNTDDKIFLLSYNDSLNHNYGFIDDNSRKVTATDYAKGMGIYVYEKYGTSSWSLRSPYAYYPAYVRDVDYFGQLGYDHSVNVPIGIRPALILLQEENI